MKHSARLLVLLMGIFAVGLTPLRAAEPLRFDTVEGDPLRMRLYTLPNGLRLYLTVNRDQPRVQGCVAVRCGSKNDPPDAAGAAYLAGRLLAGGTARLGTLNYAAERPLLDSLRLLYDALPAAAGHLRRHALLAQIGRLSKRADAYALPHDYEHLMQALGADGSLAYISADGSVYQEDFPAQALYPWLQVQAERFVHHVVRGFDAALADMRCQQRLARANEGVIDVSTALACLFPTLFGSGMTGWGRAPGPGLTVSAVERFYRTWYVPANTAICLSGDFDPDSVAAFVARTFGSWTTSSVMAAPSSEMAAPVSEMVDTVVRGGARESVLLAWRMPGLAHADHEKARLLARLLYNGQTGLCDVEINAAQRMGGCYAWLFEQPEASALMLVGLPKPGQSAERVRQMLLERVERLCRGEFSDDLLRGEANQLQLAEQLMLESNKDRAGRCVRAFVSQMPWADVVELSRQVGRLSRKELAEFARKTLRADNCVCVHKLPGDGPGLLRHPTPDKGGSAPLLTPSDSATAPQGGPSSEVMSAYARALAAQSQEPVAPVFVDFSKALQVAPMRGGHTLLYKQNRQSRLFSLSYLIDRGTNDDRRMDLAFDYLLHLGTARLQPEQMRREFYRLACQLEIRRGERQVEVRLSGLDDNLRPAVALLEQLLQEAQPDEGLYQMLSADLIKARDDARALPAAQFERLGSYALYGPQAPVNRPMSNEDLRYTSPQSLLDLVKEQFARPHTILYYGPTEERALQRLLAREHKSAPLPTPEAPADTFACPSPSTDRLVAHFTDGAVTYAGLYRDLGVSYSTKLEPLRLVFNAYFGLGPASLVGRVLPRGQAGVYDAWAEVRRPERAGECYSLLAHVATDSCQTGRALDTLDLLLKRMPIDEAAFARAVQTVRAHLGAERINKEEVLWYYVQMRRLGLTSDPRRATYDALSHLRPADLADYCRRYVLPHPSVRFIVGSRASVGPQRLAKYGPLQELSLQDLFGH